MRCAILLCAALAAGCGGRTALTPAPQIGWLSDDAVQAFESGISVMVRTNEWSGERPMLRDVIPLLVTIDNRSDLPLRVRYADFALVTANGARAAALPPFAVGKAETPPEDSAALTIEGYPYSHEGFAIAPHLASHYPELPVYTQDFPYERAYYSTHHPAFMRIPLPGDVAARKALPEGVLDTGGRIAGFLYFAGLQDPGETTLTANLVDAATGQQFGRIRIPFRADS
jgi:hypothetical protein